MKIVPPQPTDLTWEEQNPPVYDYRPLDLKFVRDRLAEAPTSGPEQPQDETEEEKPDEHR